MSVKQGTYRAKASGACVLGTSENKGTPYIELYFKIIEGGHDGALVRWTGYFTENTNERTIQSLALMGWKGEELVEFVDGGLHGLDSNEVDIVVEVEEYTTEAGEVRHSPKVQWVNRPGGFLNTKNAMETEAAKAFSEKLRGLVIAVRTKTPGAGNGAEFPHGANAPAATAGATPKSAF